MGRVRAFTLILPIFLGIFLLNTFAIGNEEEQSSKDAKIYSKNEFHAAVKKEVTKKLKQLNQKNIVDFSQELMEKERKLKIAELEISKEREQLKINAKQFEKKVKKFQESQTKLIGCLDQQAKEEENRISHMVDVVSGMRPKVAAEVLSVQDAVISVKILGLLPSEKVSKIFNVMEKEVSARLQKMYMTMKR